MANRTAVNVVAAVVTAAAWVFLYLFFHPRPSGIDRRPHEALGQLLAKEAVERMEPGGRLIVLMRDAQSFEVPAAEAQWDGFEKALRQTSAKVSLLRSFKVDPLRTAGVPSGDFFELLRQGRDNDVIVSFLGPPTLDPDQLARLGAKRARVLAVCSGAMPAQVDLRGIFEQKLLALAVVSRPEAPAKAETGGTQSAFEQLFRVITPNNLSDLPRSALARQY
jgi:hypothetical protein